MIRPALTAKEWATRTHEIDIGAGLVWADHESNPSMDGEAEAEEQPRPRLVLTWNCASDTIVISRRQGLAAMALYKQPFGFDWKDVDLLRHFSDVRRAGAKGDGVTDDTEAFRRASACAHLADRIAALLPPRDS